MSDICTRSCRIDEASSCNQLSSAARCTNTSIEPGAIAVCDQSCSRNQDCSALGADFACQGGYCRGRALSNTPPGGAGASSQPTGNGGGGAQSAGSSGSGAASSGSGPTGSAGSPPAPPQLCQLPFDAGPCDANFTVYTAVQGVCIKMGYGGCEGNANRFSSLEECQSVCEQRPSIEPCTDGRVEREICLECGFVGGCAKLMRVCALPCAEDATCTGVGLRCWDGICQAGGCR